MLLVFILFVDRPKSIMVDKETEWNELKEQLVLIQMRSVYNQVTPFGLSFRWS